MTLGEPWRGRGARFLASYLGRIWLSWGEAMQRARSGLHAKFSPAFRKRFRFEKVIGQGGSAVVYRALQRQLQRPVAIKVLSAVGFDTSESEGRFEDEARLASRLDHPNLCRLFEFGRDGACAYLVYEFVDGEDLARRLSRQKKTGRPGLDLEDALSILGDIARGLQYAHKLEVVHRDLKPANILLPVDGPAKITDFGLAKMGDMTRVIQTETGMVVGTPECMAPEQAMGKEVGPAADIYALGCLFFWMLAGRPPFEDESAGKVMVAHIKEKFPDLDRIRPNLGSGVYTLLDEMVRRRPEGRPKPTEILRALKLLEAPVRARSVDVSQALSRQGMKIVKRKPDHRRRWLMGGAIAAFLALFLGVGAWWWWPRPMPREVEYAVATTRSRIRWKGPERAVRYRPKHAAEGWAEVSPRSEGGLHEVLLEGLEPDQIYIWEFVGSEGRESHFFRTFRPLDLGHGWPRYDSRGNPAGWLLRVPTDAVLVLPGGEKAVARGDGLTEVGEEEFSLERSGGLPEAAPSLGVVPTLARGIEGFIREVVAVKVRSVLASAARARARGEVPTLAARKAAGDVYASWKGLEPAMAHALASATPETRLHVYLALDTLRAVDRALQNEGFPPVFGSQDVQLRSLEVSCKLRSMEAEEGNRLELVTAKQRASSSGFSSFAPPREPLPEGRGDLVVQLALEDLWADRFLFLEFVRGKDEESELGIPVRPPCRDFRFEGQVRLVLPERLVADYDAVRVHVRSEDLPRVSPEGQRIRFPFIRGEGGGVPEVRPGNVVWLVSPIQIERIAGGR